MDQFSARRKPTGNWINSSFCNPMEPSKLEPKTAPKRATTLRKIPTNYNGTKATAVNSTWVEKYAPKRKVDLAVHKKKVEQVEEWFVASFDSLRNNRGNKAPILLLTGPCGSGKSATVRALAEELSFELQEWENVQHLNYRTYFKADDDMETNFWWEERQADTFRNFVIRASKYCSVFSKNMKKAILIEEFPNVFVKDAGVFHSILRKFSDCGRVPAIFIISDSSRGDASEKHLFPKDLQEQLNVTHISFNSIANGAMGKVLNSIYLEENKKYGATEKPNLDLFVASSNGDIRNAINLLQFSILPDSKNYFGKPQKAKRQRREDEKPTDCSKDSNLFLFHALGKVLYCKRLVEILEPDLPPHLIQFRRKQLIESPEGIFDKTAVSAEGFSLFLHHNYPDFMPDIITTSEAADFFSQADFIGSRWDEQNALGIYSVSLAIRGLMFQLNPNEVKGQTKKGCWRAIHKPDWYAKHRKVQENMFLLCRAFPEWRLSFGEDVQTLILPYMAKMKATLQNPDQRSILSSLTTFQKPGSFSNIQMFEQDTEEEDESDFYCSVEPPKFPDNQEKPFVEDEEIVIEEFDY